MKLYVGNLPREFSEQELRALFDPFGKVLSAKIIIDRDTGSSKGFGFVEFDSKESGMSAIKALNKKEVGQNQIVVNEARPLQERRGPGGGGGGGGYRPRGPGQDRERRGGDNRFSSNKRYSTS